MRFFALSFGAALTLTLAGCSSAVPSAIAPGGPTFASAPPPPPPPLEPAAAPPIAQPDPDGPHARELRAEELLGRIARAAARLRARESDARTARERHRIECISVKAGELDAVERAATALRDKHRASLFDGGDAADAAWGELVAQVDRASEIATEAEGCPAHDPLAAGGFGPNDVVMRAPPRVMRVTLRSPPDESETASGPVFGKPTNAPPAYAVAPVLALAPGNGAANPPPPSAPAPPAGPSAGEAVHDASMLLRSAQLALAVFEVEKNVDAVEKIASDAGGYLALRGDRQITVRVPKTRFDDAIRRIEKLGDVLHRNVSSEDVTDQYVDLELRLKNATAVRARLEKLLEHATVKDAVEIHRELAKVTDEIERLEGKLKLLKDRVAFSTITVTFERSQTQQVRAQALLPFPWMQTMGLEPLLKVNR